MRAVLYGDYPACELARLRPLLSSHWDLYAVADAMPFAQKAAYLINADALITSHYRRHDPVAPKLRLLQCSSAGTEDLDLERLPPNCAVCNAYGHEEAVAEYVIWAVLDWSLSQGRFANFFVDGRWSVQEWTSVPNRREVKGQTLGVVGFGHIGRAVARRAKALGMRVLALSTWHTDRPSAVLADRAFTMTETSPFLGESDFIAICCPLNDTTRGMIGWEWFANMRRNAVVIQVSRGPVVDEESFYRALHTGFIRGATIDVWYEYPARPQQTVAAAHFPFHELPNVVATPHIAARTEEAWDRRFRQIAANLDALAVGRPLANVVECSALPVAS